MSKQYIQVGEQQIPLPDGVKVDQWALEKVTLQNPRIRSFLGCIKLLGTVLESNYAILHCSPERLHEIWRKVRKVSELIRRRITPLLQTPSCIPALEEARDSAAVALEMLEGSVLDDLDKFPKDVAPHQLMELRKLLCVSIGQLHAFLQDTFSQLAASDPRSGGHDADYFLSRRFSADIEEAEWLHATVKKLHDYLEHLQKILPANLSSMADLMRRDKSLPDDDSWENIKTFLDLLTSALTPKIKEVLALRGIRFYEMEILDRYAMQLPIRCKLLVELHETASSAIEQMREEIGTSQDHFEQCSRDLKACHAVFSDRISGQLAEIDKFLHDLMAFIPLWLKGIEKRRAMMLKKNHEGGVEDDRLARNIEPLGANLLS